MTSQPGYQSMKIYMLPNSSRSKGNQKIKSGQVIEQEKYFSSIIMWKMGNGTILFFEKALYKVKASGLQHSFNKFR